MEKLKKFIPFLIGLILLGGSVFFYFRAGELAKVCTEKTTATVVNMREDFAYEEGGMRYIYYPIIEYTVNNEQITGELGSGSNPPLYSVNETLEILYNPSNAEEFIVAGENQNLTWIILGGLGVIFLAVGIYTLVKK